MKNAMETDRIMAKAEAFPGLSATVIRLLSMLEDPDVAVTEIEAAMRYDVGLTANVLKMANAAYFGFSNQIRSVRQAMMLLGARRLTQLVLTTCVNAMMQAPVPGYELDSGQLWHHSIAVSVVAERLAKQLQHPRPDEVFTAGLLHDVGKLVLGEFLASHVVPGDLDGDPSISFELIERRTLGADHAEVGAKLLEKWSFPADLVRAVRYHHRPDEATPPATIIDIVHTANVLCLMIGIGVGREGLQYTPSDAAVQRLGLQVAQFERLASQALQWVGEMAGTETRGNE